MDNFSFVLLADHFEVHSVLLKALPEGLNPTHSVQLDTLSSLPATQVLWDGTAQSILPAHTPLCSAQLSGNPVLPRPTFQNAKFLLFQWLLTHLPSPVALLTLSWPHLSL